MDLVLNNHQRLICHKTQQTKPNQNETKKPSYRVDWQQEVIWYNPAELYNRLSQNVQDIQRSHKVYQKYPGKLEIELRAREKSLAVVKIQREIFQGDALSPLLFVLAIMPLSHIFRKCTGGYKLHKSQDKNHQLMNMDNRRCPWCNGYRHRKWTRRHEFKSWMRLIAFHIALIHLGKVSIHLFSLQLWVNSWAD